MIAVLTGLLLAGATVAALTIARGNDEPVDETIALLRRDTKFDSSREAVVHFADAYQHLVDAAATYPKDCDVDEGQGRCLALNQAASWSLNFSTASGQCTQPAIQEGRLVLLRYVTEADELGDDATEAPPLPPLPAC